MSFLLPNSLSALHMIFGSKFSLEAWVTTALSADSRCQPTPSVRMRFYCDIIIIMNRLAEKVLYGRGLNIAAQLSSSRQPLPSFTEIEAMRGASLKSIGCGYLQSYYLLNDGQFVKTGYFMDSLTSIRIINLHRLLPRVIPLFQRLPFLGKLLSFRGGDELPTRFNSDAEPFEEVSFGVSRVFGRAKGGIYAMGENYFGQLGTRNMLNYEHTFTRIPQPENEEISRVSCGFQHTLFTTRNDNLYACGKASDYQIQPSKYVRKNQLSDKFETPELIVRGEKVIKTAGGLKFSLIWVHANKLLAMGDNRFGQCGQSNILVPEVKEPTEVPFDWDDDEKILDIACGFCHSLILTNKFVYFMGSVEQKQNPFKSFHEHICAPSPLPIDSPVRIFASFDRSAVISGKGEAYLFGGRDLSYCGGESGELEVIEGFSKDSLVGLGFSHTLVYP